MCVCVCVCVCVCKACFTLTLHRTCVCTPHSIVIHPCLRTVCALADACVHTVIGLHLHQELILKTLKAHTSPLRCVEVSRLINLRFKAPIYLWMTWCCPPDCSDLILFVCRVCQLALVRFVFVCVWFLADTQLVREPSVCMCVCVCVPLLVL